MKRGIYHCLLLLMVLLIGCEEPTNQTSDNIIKGELTYLDVASGLEKHDASVTISLQPVSAKEVLPAGTVTPITGTAYEFGPLQEGEYMLEATYSDVNGQLTYYAQRTVTVPSSTHLMVKDIQLQWKPTHRAFVRVTDHRGHPVPSAEVFLYRSKNLRNRAITKKAGDFDMANVLKATTNYNGNAYFENLDNNKLYFAAAFREVDGIVRSGKEELTTSPDATIVVRPDSVILLKI